MRRRLPSPRDLLRSPWWRWLVGGLLGGLIAGFLGGLFQPDRGRPGYAPRHPVR